MILGSYVFCTTKYWSIKYLQNKQEQKKAQLIWNRCKNPFCLPAAVCVRIMREHLTFIRGHSKAYFDIY